MKNRLQMEFVLPMHLKFITKQLASTVIGQRLLFLVLSQPLNAVIAVFQILNIMKLSRNLGFAQIAFTRQNVVNVLA
jgi:hypothetical protein